MRDRTFSAGAMLSDYVYAGAVGAQAQGKLVDARPADMSFRDIPEPFNIQHIDEVEDHEGMLATIAKEMAGTPIPTRVPLHEIYYRIALRARLARTQAILRTAAVRIPASPLLATSDGSRFPAA